jgi:hypothetical protein
MLGGEKPRMIGEKRAGLKVSPSGVLAELTSQVTRDLALRGGAAEPAEKKWNALKAAKEAEAARRKFELENSWMLVRRY